MRQAPATAGRESQVEGIVADLTILSKKYQRRAFALQPEDIGYRTVSFAESKGEIWLPSSTEMHTDFIGRRFYCRHSFLRQSAR
jgi:hypothetical protein